MKMDASSLPTNPLATNVSVTHHGEDSSAAPRAGSGDAAVTDISIGSRGRLLTITTPRTEERRHYEFGEVLGPEVTNKALCERLTPSIMTQLVAGYSVCVLCYGQTGSGKTYTMSALAPAVAEEVFRSIDANNEMVEMSCIQIYKDKAYNLLGGARADTFGVELSTPMTSCHGGGVGVGGGGGCCHLGSAPEPKVLIRSTAEMMAKMKAAFRLCVTDAHSLNARSSRSFIILSLHLTCFLEGAPITTTRVTLVDLAGTGGLSERGATGGEAADQAVFIERSLMALRQCVVSGVTDAELPQFRESLLTTYLAPCLRSWHLILLLTVSLEAGSYEETESSLEFGTKARYRKVKKVKRCVEEQLSGSVPRRSDLPGFFPTANTAGSAGSKGGAASLEGNTAVRELQGVVEVLQYRIEVLEEALRIDLQRTAMAATHSSLTGGPLDAANAATAALMGVHATPLADAEALQHELRYYRGLLQERKEDLRRLRGQPSVTGAEVGRVQSMRSNSFHTSSPALGEDDVVTDVDPQEPETAVTSAEGNDSCDTHAHFGESDADDAHAQLLRRVGQLGALPSCCNNHEDMRYGVALDALRNAALRATEEYDEVRERLLVVSSSLGGMRTQYRRLVDEVLRVNKRLLATDEVLGERCTALEAVKLRAATMETERESLRLQLFQAYADQSIREDMTRLYLDTKLLATNADEAVAGDRQTEQQVELEKVQAHQQVLCGKITELVDNVEQLTRSVAQRDVSLAALESVITPAQRALFHTSNTVMVNGEHGTGSHGASDGRLLNKTSPAIPGEDGGSAADCFSLLQSCVSELSSLLTQERQQHQLTQCELLEAREDARRSRQEQRQALFQQQEEERRVVQLTRENYELRQQNRRHQLYLDQMHASFHEQLQQLRHRHEEKMAELRSTVRDLPWRQCNSAETTREGYGSRDEDNIGVVSAVATPVNTGRNTLQRVSSSRDRPSEGTMRGCSSVSLAAVHVMGSGDKRLGASTRRQRSSRGRHSLTKPSGRHRRDVEGLTTLTTYSAVEAATAAARPQHIRRSSKVVARRSSSVTRAKLQLFATYGGPANPGGAPSPFSTSDVLASARPATRRRVQTPTAPHGKRQK
ncbi:hypothetical protein JKF63_06632 [Porcisia hertigi]|uniref:Kinesin motor domain-containing protein n=1 Tax=Porcisia hertigi TaxID=2761500 RepID=A0A836LIK1_9TRYP|nr:hypothetical protein JKF63_06632 [Porcisia hertigi]